MTEGRNQIRISIDKIGGELCTQFFEESNITGIRVFPASRYVDGGARTLPPSELNEAVTMWMNRGKFQKEPALVVCPDGEKCGADFCGTRKPHKKGDYCDGLDCPLKGTRSGPCIPYKEPAKHDDARDSFRYVWVKHDLKKEGGADLPAITALSMRMSRVESDHADLKREYHSINKVLDDLEKKLDGMAKTQ
jgi:hypothetical protein